MPLTTLLKKDQEVIKLFNRLPDLRPYFKSYQIEKTETNKPIVPRVKGAEPGRIGTAYDFFCRAYIQQINQLFVEKKISVQVLHGIEIAAISDFFEDESEWRKVKTKVDEVWHLRSKYINGQAVDEEELIKGSIILANCEFTMRTGQKPPIGYLHVREEDFLDLQNLVAKTKEAKRFFQTKEAIYMNPSFGDYSKLVGGADADYILNTTLVDIKTTVYATYNKAYIHQLIGYYLLSRYDPNFPIKIEYLAVFLARFNRLVVISIADIEQVMDMKAFSQEFLSIITDRGQKKR